MMRILSNAWHFDLMMIEASVKMSAKFQLQVGNKHYIFSI